MPRQVRAQYEDAARNRLRGHLFSGRYKAVLVEQNDYLSTLAFESGAGRAGQGGGWH